MDVIGLLCVSLGSSTVQLNDSLGSRCICSCSEADISSQNGDRAREVYYWDQSSVMQKDSIQRMFLVGSVCHVKWFTTGSRNSLKDVRKSQMMSDQAQKWLTQQSKDFYDAGIRRTGKAMGQVYQCWWRICREIHVFFFQVRMWHVLLFTSICDLLTDSPS
jgi:hypothetical protein